MEVANTGAPNSKVHQWGVILAGGEGVRLKPLTRMISGDDRPKQFCPVLPGRSLLSHTRLRIAPYLAPERTQVILLKAHEAFYSSEFNHLDARQMAIQPRNRGTLPAILLALVRVLRSDADAQVAFFPADHYYRDEGAFMSGVQSAFAASALNPESVILLGATPDHPETGYGWIEASGDAAAGLRKVRRFWEKPATHVARQLLERGCAWNTFVMVGRAKAFWELIRWRAEEVMSWFEPLLRASAGQENLMVEDIYDSISSSDFSSLVLSSAAERLRLLSLPDIGWSDLGEPQRVYAVLSSAPERRRVAIAAAAGMAS